MNREVSLRCFESERRRLSHDLLANEFFMRLGPAWYEGRLGPDDVVFHALLGDEEDRRLVQDALKVWRLECSPVFRFLSEDLGVTFGFVVTDVWREGSFLWSDAATKLDLYALPDCPMSKDAARSEATRFWDSCDVVRDAVMTWREHFSDLFSSWDANLIQQAGDHE